MRDLTVRHDARVFGPAGAPPSYKPPAVALPRVGFFWEADMPNKPASAPDEIPPRQPPEPEVGSDSEGSNAVQHEPNPQADKDREPILEDGRKLRGPYPTGNV